MLQILEGLAYIHGQGYAHRDIKLENNLLDVKFIIKITDFGFGGHYLADMETTIYTHELGQIRIKRLRLI